VLRSPSLVPAMMMMPAADDYLLNVKIPMDGEACS
jgi:hypothetical protein